MEAKSRLVSLDILRGITIAGMIIVNSPGSWEKCYTPLKHSMWNGLTPTDLVFPFFMFIMGVSTYISLKKNSFRYDITLIKKILKRTVLLFLLGLFINWYGQGMCALSELRIPGVLQRLALCYFIVMLIGTHIKEKYLPLLIVILLVIYQVILMVGNGFINGSQNIIAIVDNFLIGSSHLYVNGVIDPEGILSTLPSIAHTLIGFYIGGICVRKEDIHLKLERCFLIGTTLLFAGYLLSYGCPINKRIWSPTYVLITCGAAILLLSLLMWMVDISRKRKGLELFVIYGVNPLFCYIAGELLFISLIQYPKGGETLHDWLYQNMLVGVFGDNAFSSLMMPLLLVAIIGCIGYVLYRKNIYIKI